MSIIIKTIRVTYLVPSLSQVDIAGDTLSSDRAEDIHALSDAWRYVGSSTCFAVRNCFLRRSYIHFIYNKTLQYH